MRARLARALRRRLRVPDISLGLDRVADQGFSPRLIFDVGADLIFVPEQSELRADKRWGR